MKKMMPKRSETLQEIHVSPFPAVEPTKRNQRAGCEHENRLPETQTLHPQIAQSREASNNAQTTIAQTAMRDRLTQNVG